MMKGVFPFRLRLLFPAERCGSRSPARPPPVTPWRHEHVNPSPRRVLTVSPGALKPEEEDEDGDRQRRRSPGHDDGRCRQMKREEKAQRSRRTKCGRAEGDEGEQEGREGVKGTSA